MDDDVEAAMAALMGESNKKKKRSSKNRLKRPRQKAKQPLPSKFLFPAKRDITTFAKELGMDLEFDSEHQWLIDQALAAELPPLWSRIFNPSGRSYYVREPTKQEPSEIVTWVHPLVPAYSKIFENILQEQQEAQKAALGIISDEEQEEEEGETDIYVPTTPGAPKLSKLQRKKLRASLEDALLYYKSELGDPETEDVRPKEECEGYWDCEPEDVEDMAEFLGIDPIKQNKMMWIARMACVVPLPPGWKAHGNGDNISIMAAESKNISIEELGELYSCKSWMCKTDAVVAKMALDIHPSHQYFEILLNEAIEELMGQEGEEDGDDEFSMEDIIPCEFRNETGGIYTYNFKTEEIQSTGRNIPLDDDDDDDEVVEEKGESVESVESEEREVKEDRKDGIRDTKIEIVENKFAEFIDRTKIQRNKNGSEEPNSLNPELWNVDNCEVDMLVKYKMGGQMWYLQSRMRENTAKNPPIPIPGYPMNQRARDAKRYYSKEDEGEFNINSTNFCDEIGWKKIESLNPPNTPIAVPKKEETEEEIEEVNQLHNELMDENTTIIENENGNIVGRSTILNQPSEIDLLILRLCKILYGNNYITKKQILDFAEHIELDVNASVNGQFLYLIEECFAKNDSNNWQYRSDPNGNYHYYKSNKGIDLTKGEEPSGWDSNFNGVEKLKENELKNDPPIQSTWKHPKYKQFKKLYKKEKFQYEEALRTKRVKGLRRKSSLIHLERQKLSIAAGGQRILTRGHLGEELALTSATQNNEISKPDQAEIYLLQISPAKRSIPLQPGFADVQLKKLKKEKLNNRTLTPVISPKYSDNDTVERVKSPIQNLLREGQTLYSSNKTIRNDLHRAFRDCSLIDTAEEQRQREEERRMSRRKKKIDLSKSKREIKKNKLDEQANLAKAMMTSSTLPPLQLDAKTHLGVISLSPNKKENKSKSSRLSHSPQLMETQQYRYEERDIDTAETIQTTYDDNDYNELDTILPKKGILSPSHQGRFAAIGNLVPVNSSIWLRAHDDYDYGGNYKINDEEQANMNDIEKYKKEYDEKNKEDDQVIDDWLLKKRYTSDDDEEEACNSNSNTTNNEPNTIATLSFSVGSISYGVTKNVSLLPMIKNKSEKK